MIQLYILTIETKHGETTLVLHNCKGNLDDEIEKMKKQVQTIYGQDVTMRIEKDEGNEITRTKFPDHYQQIMANAMGHNAKFN